MTLGQRIQELRKQAGLSQEGLGEALGVSRQAVSKWESDGGIPELDTLIAMSRLFHITVGQLLGVETPEEQEEFPEATGGFTEEQVEDILRRYVEESRPPKETAASQLTKWGWAGAAAVVVATVLVVLFVQINSLRSTVSLLSGDVSRLQVDVSNNLNGLSGQIRDQIYTVLEEEAKLLNTFDWSLEDFDWEAQTATVSFRATLKEYQPGSTMQFIADYITTDKAEGQVSGDFVDGPNFEGRITVPLNYHTDVSIRVMDTDGTLWEQAVDTIYSLHPDNFWVEVYNLQGVFALTIHGKGLMSATTETAVGQPHIELVTGHPELFIPVEAHLVAAVNGEEVFSRALTITESMEGANIFWATIPEGYFEITLEEYDRLELTLTVTDSLGREREFRDGGVAKDGRLESPPKEAPVIQVG